MAYVFIQPNRFQGRSMNKPPTLLKAKRAAQCILTAAALSLSPSSQADKQASSTQPSQELEKALKKAHHLKDKAYKKFQTDMDKAVQIKNQAVLDLEQDLEKARARINNSPDNDVHNAINEAKSIKADALKHFDASMSYANQLKQQASSRFDSDLKAAKQEADMLTQSVEQTIDSTETKLQSLDENHTIPTNSASASGPQAVSLAKSGTLAGEELENLKQLPLRIKQTELSTKSIPIQQVPKRPDTLFYLGDPFFDKGVINTGYEIFTGAVWQPQFFPFGTYSTALQISDDGNQQISEWVNALDIYGNLNLTPTERLIIGFTPLDNDGKFSGYNFHPDGKGVNATNGHVQVLFFEGRFDSLFPGLKSPTGNWASFDFALGRQPVNYQSGILINDTIDSVGITRTSLNLWGSPEVTLTGLYAWNHINRADNIRDDDAQLFGLFSTFNYAEHQIEADIVLVYNVDDSNGSNALNFAFSSYQQFLGLVNATFSYNQSISFSGSSPRSDTGAILFSQFNLQPPYTVDNAYMNIFWGIGEFTSAARAADAGGPLGQTGLLFSATGLGNYGPALPSDGQNMFGGSIGYERYLGSIHRRIIFEFGGVTQDSAIAFGTQFEQAIGRNFVLTLGSFVSYQENHKRSVGYGVRSVFTVNF